MSVREPLLASREVSGDEYGRKVRGWFGVFGEWPVPVPA